MVIKPLIRRLHTGENYKLNFFSFKYNSTHFNNILNGEKAYELLSSQDSIIIGDSGALNTITLVSGPYCEPCSLTHEILNNLLNSRKDIKLQIIFFCTDNFRGNISKVAGHFTLLKAQQSKKIKDALHYWYIGPKDYEAWSKMFPVEDGEYLQSLKTQKSWCKSTETMLTPTIFVNGRKLPDNYFVEDLQYLI